MDYKIVRISSTIPMLHLYQTTIPILQNISVELKLSPIKSSTDMFLTSTPEITGKKFDSFSSIIPMSGTKTEKTKTSGGKISVCQEC